LDISEFERGVYFFKLLTKEGLLVKKVI